MTASFTSNSSSNATPPRLRIKLACFLLSAALPVVASDYYAPEPVGFNDYSIYVANPDDEFEEDMEEDIEEEIEEDIEEELEEEIEEELDENIEEELEDNIEEDFEEDIEEDFEEDIEESLEDDIEQDMEENLEEDMEESLEDNIEQDMEEDFEQDMEEDFEQDMEEDFEQDIEEDFEQDVEEDFEQDVEEDFEQDVEEDFEQDVEEDFEQDVEEDFEQDVDEDFEQDVEEDFEQDVDEHLDSNLEQQTFEKFTPEFEQDVEQHMDEHLTETVEEPIEPEWLFDVIEDQEMLDDAFMDEPMDEALEADWELRYEEELEQDFEPEFEEEFDPELEHEFDPELEHEFEPELDSELESAIDQVVELVDNTAIETAKGSEQEIWTENWLIFSDDEIQQQLEKLGYRYIKKRHLKALGKTLATVSAPASFSLKSDYKLVLNQLNKTAMYFDLNHIYRHQAAPRPPKRAGSIPADIMSLDLQGKKVEIGLVDTAINTKHEALVGANITQQSFVTKGKAEPKRHGTQIAGILVGNSNQYNGLLPQGRLLGASVFFHQKNKGNIATTESLLMALDWLANKEVKVINMSLSGPPNRLLEYAVNELCRQNIVIVAAVGNAGPLSKPLYPAGYECTIAVTAVDSNKRIYKNAVIGSHVDMAAFGVNLKTPGLQQSYKNASGTSMATAFVSAYIAAQGKPPEPQNTPLETWLTRHYKACVDLGAKGRDPVYGFGLLPRLSI